MTAETRPSPAVRVLVAILGAYRRWISPLFLPHCRFHPTCSAYAVGALREHGLLRGLLLAVVRLLKCAPWHPGGLDPVPARRRHSVDPPPDPPPEPDRPTRSTCTAPRGAGAPTSEEHAPC